MWLTLTATATQARFLRDRWAVQQLAAGVTAWETPPILSLQAWMRQQWERLQQQGVELPLLLSADQERRVWQQCRPRALREAEGILRQGDLVDHAIRANQLYLHWSLASDALQQLLRDSHLEELELFAEWQQRFAQCCAEQQWLEPARLCATFSELLAQQQVALPQQIHHYGLSGWSRAEQRLLEQMEQHGAVLSEYPLERLQGRAWALLSPDPQAELMAVADAVGEQLRRHPQQRLGVVVPDLAARRGQIERVLSERLVPQSLVEAVLPQQLPYRLSSGEPLLQDPRIHHALQLLRLLQQPLPLLELSALLRSPWLLRGAEMEARSQIDLRLRHLGLLELSLPRLLQLLAQGAVTAPRFLGALQALSQLDQRSASCSRWAQRFTSALSFFEWAENGEQNSVAFNAYNGWREALDRFVALEEVLGSLSVAHAQQELRQLLSGMELEGGRSGRPLEVMTPQQADGVRFDALWVLSCDDSRWPVQPPLSPFLPQQWQRQRLPGADPAEAQQQARALLQRLRSAAATVCFSCSEREQPGGEVVRGLTPLLGRLEWERAPARTAGLWWQAQSPLALEPIEEPSLELPQGVAVRGGSTLLANQSQCPFRAFVRHRLQAEALEQPQAGLAARERGTLLHLLLERCWRELEGDSARLQQLDDAQLRTLVDNSAAAVVEQFRGRLQGRIGPRFAANECERLGELTLRALQLDRQRETPFRVEEMESQQQIGLAGLTLSIKMDRVDRLQDGGRVLIDYKSGKVSRSQWQGERPAAPQLPLYALLLEQVVAVLYSQIRAQEVIYRGEQQSEAVMAGAAGAAAVVVTEGWAQQLQQWREVLERLAQEFRRGEVGVTPLQGRSSCQYCGLEPLCRVEW